jgi:muramidase (phage lysozyme)
VANRPLPPANPQEPILTAWQIRRRNENAALLANPRIRAFLDTIAFSEGDTNYDSLFGNHHQTFTDRSTHPGNRGELYNGVPGGAAGRYQIMPRTYRDLNRLLGPYTMSDRDQDLMAVELIREGPALESLLSGHLDEAISRLGRKKAWTSFPVLENGRWQQNPSHQPTRNIEDLRVRFQEALNRYSQPGPGLVGIAANLRRR